MKIRTIGAKAITKVSPITSKVATPIKAKAMEHINEFEYRLANRVFEKSNVKVALEMCKKYASECEQYIEDCSEYRSECEEFRNDCESCNEQCESYRDDCEEYRDDCYNYKDECSDFKYDCDNYAEDCDRFKEICESLVDDCDNKNSEAVYYAEKYEELVDAHKEMLERIEGEMSNIVGMLESEEHNTDNRFDDFIERLNSLIAEFHN